MTLAGNGAGRWTGLAFLVFLAALFVLRPALVGWPLLSSAGVGAVFAAYVLFPGWCAARILRPDENQALAILMLAWTVGLALLACAFVAVCVLDVRELIRFYPLPFVLLAAARAKRQGPALALPSTSELLACALLLVLATLRSRCEGIDEWYLHGGDSAFHAGNAAELRWRWPMQDPRLAGEPLQYHFFSYVFPCVQSVVLGTAVRPGLLGTGATLYPMGFALALFATARGLGVRTWISAACGAVLVLHHDLGWDLESLFGARLSTVSYFDKGLYGSSSSALGLTFLLSLLHVIGGLLRAGARKPGSDLVLAGILALAASGTKGSVLPPLLAGLAVALGLRFLLRREVSRTPLLLLGVLAAGALPMTLFLVVGESSYASSMFAFEPFAAQRMSPFHDTVASWLGIQASAPSPWLLLALSPAWTALFLAAGTLGLLAWILYGERPRPLHEVVLLATAFVGLIPAWSLAAPGFSQLFFAYDSQVCLMLLGGVGFERAARSRGVVRGVLLGALFATLALQVRHFALWPALRYPEALQSQGTESSRGYQEALAWIRDHVEPDAVLLVGPTWVSPSTWTERRVFFESSLFASRTHARWRAPWRPMAETQPPPFADREDLQERFLADPDPAALAEVRARLPAGTPLYALRDDVHLVKVDRRNTGEFRTLSEKPWGRSVGAELVHATPWLEVYRLP